MWTLRNGLDMIKPSFLVVVCSRGHRWDDHLLKTLDHPYLFNRWDLSIKKIQHGTTKLNSFHQLPITSPYHIPVMRFPADHRGHSPIGSIQNPFWKPTGQPSQPFSESRRFQRNRIHRSGLLKIRYKVFPKIGGKPLKSSILIGVSIIFTINTRILRDFYRISEAPGGLPKM